MRRDRWRRALRAVVLAVAAATAGCDDAACTRTSDCPSGQTCSATGGCQGGVDAASPDADGDAATVDAGDGDAATLDAGDGDAATLDAGDGDAATLDAPLDAAVDAPLDAPIDAAAAVDAAVARHPPGGAR